MGTRRGPRPSLLPVLLLVLLLAGCGEAGSAGPLPPVGNQVGALAPPLEGRLAGGERYEPVDGPRVVLFYRGWDCGICRARLQRLREHLPAYAEAGVEVVAATPDTRAGLARAAAALDSAVALVAVDTAALRAWGLHEQPGEPPRPGAFVLDERGVIRFRHVGRNAGDRVSDAELLTAVAQMRDRPE